MAQLLDCKIVAAKIREQAKQDVDALKAEGISPKLGMVRVGEKGPDLAYERTATRLCEEAGILVEVLALPEDVSEADYIAQFKKMNADPSIHGILPFRPLDHIDEKVAIGNNLLAVKDVDAGTDGNLGKVVLGDPTGLQPCTPAAIMAVLDYYDIDVKAQNVVIVNNSNVFGKPLSLMLTNRFATVTICHEFTKDLASFTKNADILITAVPVENLITADMVSEDSILIDATIIRKEGKIIGCLSEEAREKCKAYTPVPGLGTVTSSLLVTNVVKACQLQK